MKPAISPIFSVFGVPRTRVVSMSRPCESVPRTYAAEGGRRGGTAPTLALRASTRNRPDQAEEDDEEEDAHADDEAAADPALGEATAECPEPPDHRRILGSRSG